MDTYNLEIHNISGQIPKNPNYDRIPIRYPNYDRIPIRYPNYDRIPIRNQEIQYIVWHCDDAENWTHKNLIEYDLKANHIDPRGCPVPTYTYYIERDGSIWQLNQEVTKTWHAGVVSKYVDLCPRWNDISLAICFAFKPNKKNPLPAVQMESGLYLTTEILLRRHADSANVKGHRELCGTGHVPGHPERLRKTCPGLGIDMNSVRAQLHNIKLSCMNGQQKIERAYVTTEGVSV